MAGAGNSINGTTAGICGFTGTGFNETPVTQYDVLVGGATSSTISNVGPGTAGQILQSGGNAANPAYSTSTYPTTNAVNTLLYASSANVMAALPTANNGALITNGSGVPSIGTVPAAAGGTGSTNFSGNVTLISSQAASSSASIVFTSGITGFTYYIIEIIGLLPATNATDLLLTVSTDGGGTYKNSGYQWTLEFSQANGASTFSGGTSQAFIQLNDSGNHISNGSTTSYNGRIQLFNLASSTQDATCNFSGNYYISNVLFSAYGAGKYVGTGPINALKIAMSSGNITSGTIRLLGCV